MFKRALIYSCAALLFLLGMRMGSLAQGKQKKIVSVALVPAYHPTPPRGRLAPTLPPRDFPKNPVAEHAYAVASHMEALLYQLPCYCNCDHELGHTSLLSCYQTRHAAECGVCQREAYYAYEQSRKGRTAKEIRVGIIRGDWQHVNLAPWHKPMQPRSASASVQPLLEPPASGRSGSTRERRASGQVGTD